MIKAECDRCGQQEQTPDVSGRVTLGMRVETPLPGGWREVALRDAMNDEVAPQRWQLCSPCVNAFLSFFENDGAVPGLLEPESLPELNFQECPFCTGEAQYGVLSEHIKAVHPDRWPTWAELEDEPKRELTILNPAAARLLAADPRPNLTERARKLSRGDRTRHCTCAGVGFGTEDCAVHHPDGLKDGTHLKCMVDAEEGECPGIYRRGMFSEHMERWHGVKIAEGSKPCPYCPDIYSGIMKLGQHIAAAHPGDWQAWCDGGSKTG